jgi:ribonucleoside-diphosphate reductase alpha chain
MRMELPQGSLYINITHKDNKPFELFAILGKSGLDNHAYCEALGRMVSLCLRSGISAEAVSKTLKGIRGRDWGLWGDEYIWSVPHALGVALEYSINKPLNSSIKEIITHCPECGGKMVMDNGCMKCLSCEYSKCSS